MSGLEYPKWATSAGLHAAVQLVAIIPTDEALIDRLLMDNRMETVWRFLSNPKKCNPSPAALDRWRKLPVLEGLSDQDVALAVFFNWACGYAHFNFPTMTTATLVKDREPFLISACRLQEEAQLLRERWSEDPEAEVHAVAIEAAISFHKSKTKKSFQAQTALGCSRSRRSSPAGIRPLYGHNGQIAFRPKYVWDDRHRDERCDGEKQ